MPRPAPERQAILDVMEDGCLYSPTDLAVRLGKTPNATTRLLRKMEEAGQVMSVSYGKYALPSKITDESPPPPARRYNPGVYVLRCGDYYKIGKSDDVPARVAYLQTALPQASTHVHTVSTDDPATLERQLHARFADKRVRGEWFALDMFDVDELCSL